MLLQLICPYFVLEPFSGSDKPCQRRVGLGWLCWIIGPVAQSVRAGDS